MTIKNAVVNKSLALALFACAPISAWSQTRFAAPQAGSGAGLVAGVGSLLAPGPRLSATLVPAGLTVLPLAVAPNPVVNPRPVADRVIAADPRAGLRGDLAQKNMIELTAAVDAANNTGSSARLDEIFDAVRRSGGSPAMALAVTQPAASAEATPGALVPAWFDASGLSFAFLSKAEDGSAAAVLRHGRYELGVFLDAAGGAKAIFTKYALNPMGTPMKEDVALQTAASRQAAAALLRRIQDASPLRGKEKAVFDKILSVLEGSRSA